MYVNVMTQVKVHTGTLVAFHHPISHHMNTTHTHTNGSQETKSLKRKTKCHFSWEPAEKL